MDQLAERVGNLTPHGHDFGESRQQPVVTFMELPTQFSYLDSLTERVKPEGMINNEDLREMVDKQLDLGGHHSLVE